MITLHLESLKNIKKLRFEGFISKFDYIGSISKGIEWQIGTFDDHALSLIWLINCSQTKRNGIKLLVFC